MVSDSTLDSTEGPEVPALVPWLTEGEGEGLAAGEVEACPLKEFRSKWVCKPGAEATFAYGNPGVAQGVGSPWKPNSPRFDVMAFGKASTELIALLVPLVNSVGPPGLDPCIRVRKSDHINILPSLR